MIALRDENKSGQAVCSILYTRYQVEIPLPLMLKFCRILGYGGARQPTVGMGRLISIEQAEAARRAYNRGDTFGQIQYRLNISNTMLYAVLFKKKTYKNDPGPNCVPKKGNGRKFSRVQADRIRSAYKRPGATQSSVADLFNTDQSMVGRIVNYQGIYAEDKPWK